MADERWIHPRHGICRVRGKQERQIGDEKRTYVEVEVEAAPSGRAALTLLLPEDELDDHLRPVVSKKVADEALKALTDRKHSRIEGAANWRARVEKTDKAIDAGDLAELARILRDLIAQDRDSGLSNSEQRSADHVRDLLVGELVGAYDWSTEDAIEALDERLGTGDDPDD